MTDPENKAARNKKKRISETVETAAHQGVDTVLVRNERDPGDATARNFRYQYAYCVIILIAAKRGDRPYRVVWCEHHEDFLAERHDGTFDGYQVKTSRPERGAWTLRDPDLIRAIGRFVDLVNAFGDRINGVYFVSNTDFDKVTTLSRNEEKRARCPGLFLEHVRGSASLETIAAPYLDAFIDLQTQCGCTGKELFAALRRMNLILGPSRDSFDAVLSHEHLGHLEACSALNATQLDAFRDDLVAMVYRASSLLVTDPIRHLRPVIDGTIPDPIMIAKRLVVEETVVYRPVVKADVEFIFHGEPEVPLGTPRAPSVLQQKLERGDLADQVDDMRTLEREAEYNLLEDVGRRPEAYPALQYQIEQMVLRECREAQLRARLNPEPYGAQMLIAIQDGLRLLAKDRPGSVGYHKYECLIGVAALLCSQCRVWWSPRFSIATEAP